jgi:serine/threonine-protein kinase
VPLLRDAVDELTRVLGAAHVQTLYARAWWAAALYDHGEADAALAQARRAVADAQAAPDPDTRPLLNLTLARLEMLTGALAPAEARLRAALVHFDTTPGSAQASRARLLLGETELRRNRAEPALTWLQQARAGAADRWLALALLGAAHLELGQVDAARRELAEAESAADLALPPGHVDRERARALAAVAAWSLDAAARPRAQAALARYSQALDTRVDAARVRAELNSMASSAGPPRAALLALLRY